jgi:hypothetical protein
MLVIYRPFTLCPPGKVVLDEANYDVLKGQYL